jgi:hypothetical protein
VSTAADWYGMNSQDLSEVRLDASYALVDDVGKMMPGAEALGIKRWKPVYRKDNDKQND